MFDNNEQDQIEKILRMVLSMEQLELMEYNDVIEVLQCSSKVVLEDYDLNIKKSAVMVLYKLSFLNQIKIELSWIIYWIIEVFYQVKDCDELKKKIRNRKLYRYIFNNIRININKKYNYRSIDTRNKEVVVVITSQFLSYGHAPTVRVMDYSYTIQKKFNKKVIIINDSSINYIIPDGITGIEFEYINELDGLSNFKYKGMKFTFYQNPKLMPDLDAILYMCNMVYELNPLYIYNIGATSFVSDICSEFTTVMTLPCSYELPISECNYLLIGRKLNEKDKKEILDIREEQHIIETEINYMKREINSKKYNRKDYNIDEDKFVVCIVGNRLDYELDDIIGLIRKISYIDDIVIMFIGDVKDKTKILKQIRDYNKIKFCGFVDEASSLIAQCNLYINPKRKGGGRSSFEALVNGIPVITLKYGDVFYTAGEEFSAENISDMEEILLKYCHDKVFYNEMSQKAIERARKLSNIEETIGTAINQVIKCEIEREKNN